MTSGTAIEHVGEHSFDATPSTSDHSGSDQAGLAQLPASALGHLAALSTTLAGRSDDARAPERVAEAIAACFGAEHASIMVHDAEREALMLLRPAFGIDDPELLDQYRVDLVDGGHSVKVFTTGTIRVVNGARSDHDLLRRHVEFLGLESVLSAPLVVGDETIGVLHVVNRAGGFGAADVELLAALSPLVALWVSARRTANERRRHDRRVAELVRLHGDLTDLLAERLGPDGLADLLRHHLTARERLAAGFRVALIDRSQTDLPASVDGLRPRRRWVMDAVDSVYGDGLVVPWRHQVVAVVPVELHADRSSNDDRLAEDFIDRLTEADAWIGVSAPGDLDRLDEALSEADHALGIARRSSERTLAFERLGLLRVLRPEPGSDDFAGEVLGPLREHDDAHSADLVATLRAWAAADYSITDAAGQLDVHRNTVKYRLRQIRELLGFDPSTSPHRLRVELALQLDALTPERVAPTFGDTPQPRP